jgi:hypothetical protein
MTHQDTPSIRVLELILILMPYNVMNPLKNIVILLNLQLVAARNAVLLKPELKEHVYLLLKNWQ